MVGGHFGIGAAYLHRKPDVSGSGCRLPRGFYDQIGNKLWLPGGCGQKRHTEHAGRPQVGLGTVLKMTASPTAAAFSVWKTPGAPRAFIVVPRDDLPRVQMRRGRGRKPTEQPSRAGEL